MGNKLRQLCNLMEILSEKEGRAYLRSVRRPSFSAFRLWQGIKAHCGTVATVVDVGANRGQFALASRYFFPQSRIYAFEPIPGLATALLKKFATSPEVHVENAAVGSRPGQATFRISEYDHLSSLVPPTMRRLEESPSARLKESVEVRVVTLDEWFFERQTPESVLLKLDVQGFEGEVLDGAREFLKRVDYLLYESAFAQMYQGERTFSDMFDFVRALGFELIAPLDFWTGPSKRICEVDLLWRRKK